MYPHTAGACLLLFVLLSAVEGGANLHGEGLPLEENLRLRRQVISGPTTHIYQTGPKGEKGAKGSVGEASAAGAPGEKGVEGPTGATGFRGLKGEKGEPGVDGGNNRGVPGAPGPPGQPGATGATGSTGTSGQRGVVGNPGKSGDQGLSGLEGEPGGRGETGLKGSRGAKGPQGRTGVAGDDGDKGSTGDHGPTGATGSRGPAGDSLSSVLSALTTCSSIQCEGGTCEETLVGPICNCENGYQFVPGNNRKCEDRNECAMSMCQQNCENTDGGFTCSCLPGYILQADGKTCERAKQLCDCSSEERCSLVPTGSQCLPKAISVFDAGDKTARAAAQSSNQIDLVPVKLSGMVSISWVTVFIIWGVVLTILILALGAWLWHEGRKSTVVQYGAMNGSAVSVSSPRSVILTPSSTIDRRFHSTRSSPYYITSMPRHAQIEYPDNYVGNENVIYN